MIGTDSIVKRKTEELLEAGLGSELVLLDMRRGNYLSLNTVGMHIWSRIAEPVPVEALIAALRADFEVDEAQCRNAVIAFLEQLREQELIEVQERRS